MLDETLEWVGIGIQGTLPSLPTGEMLSVVAAIEASEKKVDTDKQEFKSEAYRDIHISKAYVQDKHPEDAGEVIAQAVKNAITKPPSANVKRHCANARCNSDQTTNL